MSDLLGPLPPAEFRSDGCTGAPDAVPGQSGGVVCIRDACRMHDYAYHIGGTETDRRVADARLMANMLILGADAAFAMTYYRAVRVFGPFSVKRGWQYKPHTGSISRIWYMLLAIARG